MKKICVLLPPNELYSKYYGGAIARWVYNTYSFFDYNSYELFAIKCGTTHQYDGRISHSVLIRFVFFLGKLTRKIKGQSDDILWVLTAFSVHGKKCFHIHNRSHYALLLRKFGFKGTIILHLHNFQLDAENEDFFRNVYRNVDLLVVCSKSLRDSFDQALNDTSKIKVIYNAVDTELFKNFGSERKNQLLFAGRLVPVKGAHILLEAFMGISHLFPDLKLIIAGNASWGLNSFETDYELSLVEKYGSNANIEFAGHLDHHKELPKLFNESLIFCAPAIWEEPFGMVVAEAMACGTCVIVSKSGGMVELVGDAGLICQKDDFEDLKNKLNFLLKNNDVISEYSKKSIKRIKENFTWETTARTLKTLIRDCEQSRQNKKNY